MANRPTSKPRIRPIADSRGRKYYRVSYRGHTADVWQENGHCMPWNAVVEGSATNLMELHGQHFAFDRVITDMDRLADCIEAQVAADSFMTKGGLGKLARLHTDAPEYFRQTIARTMQGQHDAAETISDLIKVASKRKAPKTIEGSDDRWGASIRFTVIPGLRVEVESTHGPQVYWIGDRAESDSYNLHYFGRVEKIAAKTITVRGASKAKRLDHNTFARRNDRTMESRSSANADTMMYI